MKSEPSALVVSPDGDTCDAKSTWEISPISLPSPELERDASSAGASRCLRTSVRESGPLRDHCVNYVTLW